MNHLTENQLNEYFDRTLDPEEQTKVEAHLSACAGCRAALEELSSLAAELSALPEQPLGRDLSGPVLARLSRRQPGRVWRFALAAQAGLAIGFLILALSNLLRMIDLPALASFLRFELPLFRLPTIHLELRVLPLQWPALDLRLPSLNFHPSIPHILFLAASAFVLWGAGNAILLRDRIGVRK